MYLQWRQRLADRPELMTQLGTEAESSRSTNKSLPTSNTHTHSSFSKKNAATTIPRECFLTKHALLPQTAMKNINIKQFRFLTGTAKFII